MTIQSMQLDPNHTHSYQKVTRVGADADDKWASPTWVDTVDDADVHAAESVDLEAVGVTLAATQTGTPQ